MNNLVTVIRIVSGVCLWGGSLIALLSCLIGISIGCFLPGCFFHTVAQVGFWVGFITMILLIVSGEM